MCVTDIPVEHPDANNMLPQRFDPCQLFDLILCDGQVLRTHIRAAYREMKEACRLTVTQLAIGLEHVKSGGSMIVLLHKVEAMNTVSLLYTFSRFSSVKLFKPKKHHAKRSSFYMIATNIQSQHCEAVLAVANWKRQ
jgi:23S rRNA U2552 (ribose-2'-O)-methylase RlmE/FtsJ